MSQKLTEITGKNTNTMDSQSYLAKVMIDGIKKCQVQSEETRARIQLMLNQLSQQLASSNEKFQKESADTEKDRNKQLSLFCESYKQRTIKTSEIIKKLIERNAKGDEQLVELLVQSMEADRNMLKAVAKLSGNDNSFASECAKVSENIIASMKDVLNSLTHQDGAELLPQNPGSNPFALYKHNQANDSQTPAPAAAVAPTLPVAPTPNGGHK